MLQNAFATVDGPPQYLDWSGRNQLVANTAKLMIWSMSAIKSADAKSRLHILDFQTRRLCVVHPARNQECGILLIANVLVVHHQRLDIRQMPDQHVAQSASLRV